MSISKKLRQLNLRGIDKATALAVAQHIDALEKELSLYKSLESRGLLVRLRFSTDSIYWTAEKYCGQFFSGEYVTVQEDMCNGCSHKSTDGCSDIILRPQSHFVYSLAQAVTLSNNPLAFTSESECKKYCQLMNKKAKNITSDQKTRKQIESIYTSRAELPDEHVERLRKADRDYYEDHREEVNQKDRDKYHRLHPNARYYKKRKKETNNEQLPGQMSIEDIGVVIPRSTDGNN